VDTIGELGLFFRLSKLVFMGKSLCAEGGQNPFEPARLGAAVLFGPRMSNFTDMTGAMIAAKAAIEVRDESDLQHQVDTLLSAPTALDRTAHAALLWAESEADILDRFITRLSPFLDRLHEGS
jgi:3-deoxy-D-manno-octulosonic-acid transferase